jgi:hypothetical protein
MATLADVFASVTVTPEQGVEILTNMAQDYADKDPELVTAINTAIDKVANPEPAPPSGTSSTTKSSTSTSSST